MKRHKIMWLVWLIMAIGFALWSMWRAGALL